MITPKTDHESNNFLNCQRMAGNVEQRGKKDYTDGNTNALLSHSQRKGLYLLRNVLILYCRKY